MFNGTSGLSASDVLALTDNNNGFGGNGAWWLIVLIILFGYGFGGGYGGAGNGAQMNYVLSSDFATLQRQLSDGFGATEGKLDSISNGICSLGYDQLSQMNGINQNILTVGNTIQSAIADCCCKTQSNIKDTQYAIATNANNITQAMQSGFCQTNFNNQTNTRDIVDSQNAGTQAILSRIDALEANRKDEKIAELQAMNADLRLAASQCAQNQYLVNQLRPSPSPAYVVPNPYCNCNCGQAYNYAYGTTIA